MTQLGDSLAGHMTHWSTVDWFTVADALSRSNGIFQEMRGQSLPLEEEIWPLLWLWVAAWDSLEQPQGCRAERWFQDTLESSRAPSPQEARSGELCLWPHPTD